MKGALGRSGRKRASRASRFLFGRQGGFLTASSLMAAAGVAWGIYDSLKAASTAVPAPPAVPPAGGAPAGRPSAVPTDVLRLLRVAVSAANADGTLTAAERAQVVARAQEAGVAGDVERELAAPRPLTEIVAGVSPEQRPDVYVLAYAIVRADDGVTGAERVYLAQLAHALGLDPQAAAALEARTAGAIDGPP